MKEDESAVRDEERIDKQLKYIFSQIVKNDDIIINKKRCGMIYCCCVLLCCSGWCGKDNYSQKKKESMI